MKGTYMYNGQSKGGVTASFLRFIIMYEIQYAYTLKMNIYLKISYQLMKIQLALKILK